MGILATVNGKGPGRDRLFAAVGGKRFPAPARIENTGETPVEVVLRVRPGSGARLRIESERFTVAPGAKAETRLEAETPSRTDDDTVLEVLADGELAHEFHFTAVSLARESIFHGLGRA